MKSDEETSDEEIIHVLMVEDDAFFAEVLLAGLEHTERAQFEVVHAPSLNSALEFLESADFDVILLDLHLPDGSGLPLIETVVTYAADTAIVVLTAENTPVVALQALKAGVQDYLMKTESDLQSVPRALQYAIERKDNQIALAGLARIDMLTSLPNRRAFMEDLAVQFASTQRFDSSFALMMLDLDKFKNVNDSFGHQSGDKLLQTVGARLKNAIRKTDVAARLGGDEFAIILTNLKDPRTSQRMAEKFCKTLSETFIIEDRDIELSASIGIAIHSRSAKENPESLLRKADLALYKAKKMGRGKCWHYDAGMQAAIDKSKSVERDLARLLESDKTPLLYQPIMDARTGDLCELEVSMQCPREDGSFIKPKDYIPAAEETGMVLPLGEKLLRSVRKQQAEWIETGLGTIDVSVNLSALQLKTHLVFQLQSLITELTQPGRYEDAAIRLTISESALAEDEEGINAAFQEFSKLGIRLAVEGFGRGRSSLKILNRLPFSQIKIDRSFIENLPDSKENAAIVRAMIQMSDALGLQVVAEGVMTAPQHAWLTAQGCHAIQGPYVSEPVSADGLSDWLSARNKKGYANDRSDKNLSTN